MSSSEPPPRQRPPGPAGPRRFGGGWVTLGVVAGFVATPLLLGLAVFVLNLVASASGGVPVWPLVVMVALVGPLIAAIFLASKDSTPQRRGFALGCVIGWGVFLIIGAGVCVAIVQQLG